MMASAASSILIGSTSLTNVSSSRHRPPSLAPQRVEGWTEVWGSKDANTNSNNNVELPYLPPRYIHVMEDGCDYIHGKAINNSSTEDIGATVKNNPSSSSYSDQQHNHHHPSSMQLQLTQYRVAWFEQLVLRMSYIPHMVTNSGYAATESTGALPSLLDLSSIHDNDKNASKSHYREKSIPNKPVLVGRNQPGGLGYNFFQQCHESNHHHPASSCFIHSGSHIVDYLRRKYENNNIMGSNILFPEQLVAGSHDKGTKDGHTLYVDAMAYESMIQDKLSYIQLALRYGNDPAWEGVYKHQCIRATLDPNGIKCAQTDSVVVPTKKRAIFSFWAQYQAYSERVLAMHNLLPSTQAMTSLSTHGGMALELFRYNDYRYASSSKGSNDANVDTDKGPTTENTVQHQHHPYSSFIVSYGGVGGGDSGRVNVYRAMELADSYYAALEGRLVSSSDDHKVDKSEQITYLLGSDKPTYVDALLFAHLAEALCDIHLVLVLFKYSRLTRYFQRMYDHYFGDEYVKAWQKHTSQQGSAEDSDWIQRNNMVNALNAFNQIPEPVTTSNGNQPSNESGVRDTNMVHAIQLMQQIAVHCRELDQALRDAAALRNAEGKETSFLESCHRPVGTRLYQWLMGGDVNCWGSGDPARMTKEGSDDEHNGSQYSNKNEPPSSEEEDKRRRYQEHLSRMKRDRRSHDELWLSGVFMTVVAAFVISAAGKSKR